MDPEQISLVFGGIVYILVGIAIMFIKTNQETMEKEIKLHRMFSIIPFTFSIKYFYRHRWAKYVFGTTFIILGVFLLACQLGWIPNVTKIIK